MLFENGLRAHLSNFSPRDVEFAKIHDDGCAMAVGCLFDDATQIFFAESCRARLKNDCQSEVASISLDFCHEDARAQRETNRWSKSLREA
jgi:hypothetical protein